MKRLLGLVFNRWVLAAVLLLALALVLWIVGPLVAIGTWRPLDTDGARWTAIGALAAAVVAWLLLRAWRSRRGNASVVNALIAPAAQAEAPGESADMAAVRERFEGALQRLKRARFAGQGRWAALRARLGGRYLYELPWYLIIGAPGSGKTTALRHSGLQFPLAGQMGDHAVRGVGGTRHCDWWFTDQAVLIDTAGRFTTQDSDREADRATWSGFLALLKRSRPRQPLNGVLVTVSVTDLLARAAPERARYAAAVRQRVQELHEDLGVQLPIYLLVTKCDLLAGFMDSFATLDKAQRHTPWGYTAPLADPSARKASADASSEADGGAFARFGPEFDALAQRLLDGLVQRLQAEPDPARRARIYGFPLQFAQLRGLLHDFLEAAFAPSPYAPSPMLRGLYFISGTQEGTPIDRMLGSIARSYRLERAVLAPHQDSGKSYFLQRLLGEVVFAEAGLAGTNPRWERRRGALALAGYALLALLAAGAVTAWSISYGNNRSYLAEVDSRVRDVAQLLRTTPNRNSADLLPIEPVLDATRRLALPRDAAGTDAADATGSSARVPWSLGFGLYQGRKLDSAAHAAYDHMLVDAFLPRLALRIEEQLRSGDQPETQYEALKAYLMLRDPQHFDPAALKQHLEADWDTRLRELSTAQRAQRGRHLDALLAQGVVTSPTAQDQGLVDATRNRLAAVPLPQRVYNRMRTLGLGDEVPEFTIARAAGPNAALVFTRASGQPLTRGVPGLFTYDGYHQGFQASVDKVAKQLADEEGWVLGVQGPGDAARGSAGVGALVAGNGLSDDVRRLYLTDYAAAWDGFIADIRMAPMTSLSQSVQAARTLSASDTPLVPLVKALSRETTLGKLPADSDLLDQAQARVKNAVKASADQLAGRLTGSKPPPGGQPSVETTLVDDHFAGLRNLATAPPGGKAPIEETVALIGEVHLLLNAVETAVKGGQPPPLSPVPNKVKSEAARQPEPVRSLLDTLGKSSAKVAQIQVRGNLAQEVQSQVGEFCRQALSGRYPLDRNATRDATQADFASVFAPGGKVDKLFQDKLAPYVDTSARPWRFRPVEGTALGDDAGTLPQFQRAAVIRDTFFPSGAQPSLRLDFKPIEMDPAIAQFVLDVDGQVVRYAHGPQIPASVQWPGPRGSSQVRLQVLPPGLANGIVTDGPWALFRLFDRTERVKMESAGAPERFKVTFDLDGRKAVFEVTASSVRNPFRLAELNEFQCPNGL